LAEFVSEEGYDAFVTFMGCTEKISVENLDLLSAALPNFDINKQALVDGEATGMPYLYWYLSFSLKPTLEAFKWFLEKGADVNMKQEEVLGLLYQR
jgi:hypothetical protein